MHSPASLHLAFLPLKWHDPQVCLIQCLSDPIISQACHKILTWPRHLLVIFLYLVWLSFCSSLLWKLRDNSREEFAVLSLKPWSAVVKIPIYLTWAISNDLMFQPKHGSYAESLKRAFPRVSTLLTNGASRFLFLKGKLKVLEAFPKPLKDSYKQTNKQNLWIQRNPDFSNVQGKWKLVLITGSSKTRRFYKKTPIYHLELGRRSSYS